MKERFAVVFGVGVVLLSCICGFTNVNASETETEFVVDVDPQSMLVIPQTPVVLSLTPSQSGAFDSASFDVFASTNSKYGYTLTIQTARTSLDSVYVDADTGIASKIPAMSYREGGLSSDDFRNSSDESVLNHWGISIDNTTSFNPIQTSFVVKRTSSVVSNDRTTVNVATKINTDVAFGNYATTLNFTLTANIANNPQGVSGGGIDKPSGKEGGGGEGSIGGGGGGSGYAANTLARSYEIYYQEVLQKSIYVRDDSTPEGYHLLQDGESTANKEVYFAMQDMNPTICNRATVIPDQLQVMDLRDAKVYWIAKLADGRCWMTQNLDFNLDSNVTLTPADTDIRQNWRPSLSTLDYSHKTLPSNSISSPYWESSAYKPFSLDIGDWYWIGNWVKDGVSTYDSLARHRFFHGDMGDPPQFQFEIPFEGNGTHGHVGNYYNFSAAVAMDNTLGLTKEYYNPDTSICPAHWTLPKYADYYHQATDNDIYKLIQAYGGYTVSDRILTAEPLYFVRLDEFDNSQYAPGETSFYWMGTVENDLNAMGWYHSARSVNYGQSSSKKWGMPIRCIAR